jgi:hypothetical protein
MAPNKNWKYEDKQLAESDQEQLWQKGVKVLPSRHRNRSLCRWDTENLKVLAEVEAHTSSSSSYTKQRRSSSASPPKAREVQKDWEEASIPFHQPWTTKVLDDRHFVHSPPRATGGVVDEWYGVQKTLDNTPHRYTHHSTQWLSENLKVLPPDQALSHKFLPGRVPEYWHSGLYKTLPGKKRGVAAPQAVWRAIPKQAVEATTPLPFNGNWAAENFKVLNDQKVSSKSGSSSPLLKAAAATTAPPSPSAIPVTPGPDGTIWASGVKLIRNQLPRYYHSSSWQAANAKTVEPHRVREKKLVVENTGWDSGLFKSLPPQPPKTYVIDDDWFVKDRKSIGQEEKKLKSPLKPSPDQPPGWHSGLKTVPPPDSHETIKQYWHVENRKTLPRFYTTSATHKKEYRKYILEPRRQDMLHFHNYVKI